MTDIIQELRGLIAEATPGEWALGVRSNQRAIAGGAGEWLALLPNGHREGFGLTSDAEIRANATLIVAAINHLPALLDRLEAAERRWRPIETAPKDGTEIDLWMVDETGRGWREPDACWVQDCDCSRTEFAPDGSLRTFSSRRDGWWGPNHGYCGESGFCDVPRYFNAHPSQKKWIFIEPTHWRPLPDAPAIREAKP